MLLKAGPSAASPLARNMEAISSDNISEPYSSFVTVYTKKDARLENLCQLLINSPASQYECDIRCLEFSGSGDQKWRDFNLTELKNLLCGTSREADIVQGRLLIIEDVSKEVIELLGSSLRIDPLFFASHMDGSQADMATARASVATLPSSTRSRNFLNLHYHRVIEIEKIECKQSLYRAMNLTRKVKILPPLKGINIGLVRHCCSILSTINKDGSWLGQC